MRETFTDRDARECGGGGEVEESCDQWRGVSHKSRRENLMHKKNIWVWSWLL